MTRTIYDKPTRALLKDMLQDLGLRPGQVFTTSRAIEWFKQHYPKAAAGQHSRPPGPGVNERSESVASHGN